MARWYREIGTIFKDVVGVYIHVQIQNSQVFLAIFLSYLALEGPLTHMLEGYTDMTFWDALEVILGDVPRLYLDFFV